MPGRKEKQKSDIPFIEHLEELRQRVLFLLFLIFIFSIIIFLLFERLSIYKLFLNPINKINQRLYFYNLAEPFLVRVKLSFILSIIVSIPFILYHFFAFILPALKDKEKPVIFLFVALILILFTTGVFFAYNFILPLSINFLIKFAPSEIKPVLRLKEYVSLCITIIIATGLIFQFPLAVIFLTKIKLINYKFLLKHSGEAIIIIFIISALITPPDIYSQILIALPLILLYLISTGISFILK